MDKSLFPQGVLVGSIDLNRQEQYTAADILARFTDGATMGIVSGLAVSLNTNNTKLNVGIGATYVPDGERAVVPQVQNAISLYNYTAGVVNYVCVVYVEVQGAPEPEEVSGVLQNTRSIASSLVTVYDATSFAALPSTTTTSVTDAAGNIITTTDYTTNALDRIAIIALVTANGAGINLTNASLDLPMPFAAATEISPQNPVTGVTVISVNHTAPLGSASFVLTYNSGANTYTAAWQAPGDGSPGTAVSVTGDGSFTLVSTSGYSLVIEVIFVDLPKAISTTTLTISNIYTQTIPLFTEDDLQHRSMLGSGVVTPQNPHGMAIGDLTGSNENLLQEHEITEHVNGIIPPSYYNLLQGYVQNFSGASDQLQFIDFQAGDSIQVNGTNVAKLISTTPRSTAGGNSAPGTGAPIVGGITSVPTVTFADATNWPTSLQAPGPTSELYAIYLDQNGNLNRVKRGGIYSVLANRWTMSQASVLQKWFQIVACSDGLNTVGISDKNIIVNTDANYVYLAFDTAQSAPTTANEPRAVVVSDLASSCGSEVKYRLFASNQTDWIDVIWYRQAGNASELASASTTIKEYIYFLTPISTSTQFRLGFVTWSGSKTGEALGYGFDVGSASYDSGAFGTPAPYVYNDKRVFGTLTFDNIANNAITQISNYDSVAGTGLIFDYNPSLLEPTSGDVADLPLVHGTSNPYWWAKEIQSLANLPNTPVFSGSPGWISPFVLDDNTYSDMPVGAGQIAYSVGAGPNPTVTLAFAAHGEFGITSTSQTGVVTNTFSTVSQYAGVVAIPSSSGIYTMLVYISNPTPNTSGNFTVTFGSGVSPVLYNYLGSLLRFTGSTITYPTFRVAHKGNIKVIEGGTLSIPLPATPNYGAALTSQYLYVDVYGVLKTSGTNYPTLNPSVVAGSNPNTWGDADAPAELVTLGVVWTSHSAITAINQLPQPSWMTYYTALGMDPANTLVAIPSSPTLEWALSERHNTITGCRKSTLGPDSSSVVSVGNINSTNDQMLQFLSSLGFNAEIYVTGTSSGTMLFYINETTGGTTQLTLRFEMSGGGTNTSWGSLWVRHGALAVGNSATLSATDGDATIWNTLAIGNVPQPTNQGDVAIGGVVKRMNGNVTSGIYGVSTVVADFLGSIIASNTATITYPVPVQGMYLVSFYADSFTASDYPTFTVTWQSATGGGGPLSDAATILSNNTFYRIGWYLVYAAAGYDLVAQTVANVASGCSVAMSIMSA